VKGARPSPHNHSHIFQKQRAPKKLLNSKKKGLELARNNMDLVEHLKSTGVLKTPEIIAAFAKTDRGNFVREEFAKNSYGDFPLPIGFDQTISQPTTVAFMLELLAPKSNDRILDLGSGSGWTTALLAQIVGLEGSIIGVEQIPELVKFSRDNLKKYDFSNTKIVKAGKKLGLERESPFDKILVSASADKLPRTLIDQLKTGGRLVIPIQNSIFKIDKTKSGTIKSAEFPGFAFVPLR